MKTFEIRCSVTNTELDGDLTLSELRSTLESYYKEDFWLDTDEIIKYCEFNEISLLDYFVYNHKFDSNLTHVIDRYEVLDDNSEILDIKFLLVDLYNVFYYHWFYNDNCPGFVITDANGQSHEIGFWSDLNICFDWSIVDQYKLMYDLLKYGQHKYIDMAPSDCFTIEI